MFFSIPAYPGRSGFKECEKVISINNIIKTYVEELPLELRKIIDGLNNEYNLAVFMYLFKYGETKFSDIREELGIGYRGLWDSLKRLQKCGMVTEIYSRKENEMGYYFYDVTELGQSVLNNLMNIIKK